MNGATLPDLWAALVLAGAGAIAMAWWRRIKDGPSQAAKDDDGRTESAGPFDSGEWRKVEEALRDSQEKYRQLVDNANDAICVAQDGLIKFFNPKMQQMVGYAPDRLATIPFTEIIAEEDRAMVLDRYVRRLRGEDIPHQYEFRVLTSQGERLWIEINSVMITWDGRPASLCFFRDVNEQKRAEEALRDSEALYHSLVESLPLSIFRKDFEGRIVFANRRFCETLGRPLDELAGKTDFDLFPRPLAEKYRRDDAQVLETGCVLEDIEEHRRPDGELIYVQVLKSPIYGASGEIRGVQGMFWDVSARKRVEEKLRENAERTRLILDTAYDAFVAIDANGSICDWNPQAENVFGWSREEAIGLPVLETIFPPHFREAYGRRLAQFLSRGQGTALNKRIEISALRRDGSEFPVEVAITPVKIENAHILHAFLHDISRRKKYEADLREAKDAAEAANRAKGAFLANMSHEIRTPMNAIIGMVELVLDTPLTAEQREYLKLALESADSLLSIINDLLDFSKIESGKFDLDPIPFDLHESIGDTMRSLAVRAHKKGLELMHDITGNVPRMVVGDPNRLRQVVVNLVGNAIKFTDRGEVVMTVNCEEAREDELALHFAVRDTGIGIPKHKRDVVFNAFEQADSSTTRRFGGTGLGLTISMALVQLMGGKIWVESEQGKGSTFHFLVQFEKAEDKAARPGVPAARPALEGLRVLVVDDNATNRRIQIEMLRNWRIQAEAVDGAAPAMRALRQAYKEEHPYKLVLTDANMPDVDGFELARQIKADPELCEAIIMMLTSGDRPDDIVRCQELGISAYLMKPVKQSELFDAVAAAVGLATIDQAAEAVPEQAGLDATGGLRILLAEDSMVNQKLAVGLLERRGHSVFIANNGREALAALATQPFDLVLMDVQMPEMDGLDATRALRTREVATGNRRMPVIAMTAHAMKGDRERCLSAGMDSYISKPVRARDLFETITQVVGAMRAAETPCAPPVAPVADGNRVDWSVAMDTVGGDRQLLQDIVSAFQEEAPRLLADLRRAVDAGDADGLRRAAHTLKGSLRYFGVSGLYDRAFELEARGRQGRLAGAAVEVDPFAREVEQLLTQLARPAGVEG
ncbi:MAG: PAS domain S-box protein [Planctomycetia bacterium]|nr:PAS domain S-box protein [Planctomycetia bacterium]